MAIYYIVFHFVIFCGRTEMHPALQKLWTLSVFHNDKFARTKLFQIVFGNFQIKGTQTKRNRIC